MKPVYPAIILVVTLLASWGLLHASGVLEAKPVQLSREAVFSHYKFTRDVLAACPTERVEMDRKTRAVTIFYPREEYRDLLENLERRGWQEQEAESGRYTLGDDAIVVERGKLTILPTLARR